MKLFCEPADSQALKVLAVCKFTEQEKELELHVGPPQKGQTLPRLEASKNVELFSSNSMVLLLSKLEIPFHWLEWEATQLQLSVWTAVKKNDTESVLSALEYLESHLRNRKHLCILGEALSAIDVAVWSTLYPVASDPQLSKPLFDTHTNVREWYKAVSALASVQAALKEMSQGVKEPVKTFQQYLSSRPTPALSPSSGKQSDEEPGTPTKPALSAKQVEEAVKVFQGGPKGVPKPVHIPPPVLPSKEGPNILITSALPYVNNVPHLGNIIGSTLSADVFARYCRLRGYRTLYVCGTDEYGTATETKAVQEGVTPKEICDRYHKIHDQVYKWFNISFDYFGRTTTEEQTCISQDIFWDIQENGFVNEDKMDQLFCEHCSRFLADRFCEGICPLCGYEDARGDQCDGCGKLLNATDLKEPRCKLCSRSPIIKTSKHLFLILPKLEDQLKTYLDKHTSSWSTNSKGISYSWIRDGLKPRCITRDLKWGTPVPLEGYKEKVFYVWYDAPIGYLSITANYTKDWKQWWMNPGKVKLYNFLGKDNVPFHAVIFPAMLLGTKKPYTIVEHMSATEYLNYEDSKFSKSRGVGVFGTDAEDTGIPSDIWRFYLLSSRPESQDSSFSWADFQLRNNNELLNNFGNFVNRALMFLDKFFERKVPEMVMDDTTSTFIADVARELKQYMGLMERVQLREALKHILNISRLGNQYIQANKPWESMKPGRSAEERKVASTVVGVSANVACLLSVLLKPYLPDMADTIQSQLQAPPECNVIHDKFVCYLTPGHVIGQPKPLVQKIETSRIEELKKKFAGNPEATKPKPEAPKPKTEAPIANHVSPSNVDPAEVERLTKAVEQQGMAVRNLKSGGSSKMEIDAAVARLLELKKELALAQGIDPATLIGKPKKSKKK